MVSVCCFQCDPRLATYIISIISFLHFTVETILLAQLDTEHRLVAEDDGIKFITVFATHIFLLVASFLLFFAAFSLIRFLCIPWLIGCTLNLIIYTALLIVIFMRIMEGYNIVELEKGLFLVVTIFTIGYCMWIVVVFFMELGKKEAKANRQEDTGDDSRPKSKSIFTLYDTEDEANKEPDEEQSLFGSNRNRSRHTSCKPCSSKARKDDASMPLIEQSCSRLTTTTKR